MTTPPDNKPLDWLMAALTGLDGVAAVNLDEPSAGDLERVVKAYAECRKALAAKELEIEELKGLVKYYKCQPCDVIQKANKELNEKLAEAKSVIEFYGSWETWERTVLEDQSDIEDMGGEDEYGYKNLMGGKRAREFLAKLEQTK